MVGVQYESFLEFFFISVFRLFLAISFKGFLKEKKIKTQHLKFCCPKNFNHDEVSNLTDNDFQFGIYREI